MDESCSSLTLNLQRFMNEVVGWKWLRHENILPFVGVSEIPQPLSMVSVWMGNGDITNFIKTTPNQNPFSLVGTLDFICCLSDPTRSSWTRLMVYNTYTNATLYTATSKG